MLTEKELRSTKIVLKEAHRKGELNGMLRGLGIIYIFINSAFTALVFLACCILLFYIPPHEGF